MGQGRGHRWHTGVGAAIAVAVLFAGCGRLGYEAQQESVTDDGGIDNGELDAATEIDAANPIDAAPGVPFVIGTGSYPFRLATDETHVYWADYNDGSIHRVLKAGGESTQIVAPRVDPKVHGLTTGNGFVYYCDSDSGTISRVAKAGGAVSLIAISPCFDIAVNSSHIYWTSGDETQPALRRRALDGGSGGAIQDLSPAGRSYNLELRDGFLYWTLYAAGDVKRYSITGDTTQNLARVSDSGPWGLFVTETDVYFTEHHAGTGELSRVPIGGGTLEVLVNDLDGPHQVVVADGSVFWTNEFAGTITRLSIGGQMSVIASGQDSPMGIAVTGGVVYWTTRGGQVFRMVL